MEIYFVGTDESLGTLDFLNTDKFESLSRQEESHERVIRACFVRELVDGPTTALCKCGAHSSSAATRRGDLWRCVSGQEMEWKENITAEISLVVQIRHLRRHRLFSPMCLDFCLSGQMQR